MDINFMEYVKATRTVYKRAIASEIAYTLDRRGKVIRHPGASGHHSVMFKGSQGLWWFYRADGKWGRKVSLESALKVLHSREFAKHRRNFKPFTEAEHVPIQH